MTSITSAGAGDTFLTASAHADMIGNGARVVSGTNFTVGWYEVIAVSAGVSVQVDRAVTTGVGASGVINIGGALSLGSSSGATDDSFFEAITAGNTVYIKTGTYSTAAISVASTASTAAAPTHFIGYTSSRNDNPASFANCPTFACGSNAFTLGQYMLLSYLNVTGTVAGVITTGTGCKINRVKALNSSTTPARFAISVAATGDVSIFDSELVSQNGTGLSVTTGVRTNLIGCYLHDSAQGVTTGTAAFIGMLNIFEACDTAGVNSTVAAAGHTLCNNTFYGREAQIGIGIYLNVNASINCRFFNNIFYGLTTGLSVSTTEEKSNIGAYNTFYNNGTDVSLYTKNSTDLATNPAFVGASQITGTTATSAASVLTQAGGDFSTVTNNVDYLHVISGTGVTTGIYLITGSSGTTLTVNNALGTSSAGDIVYYVTTGHNFAIGTALKAAGRPSAMGTETTNYIDIGGVQRTEPAASVAACIMVE